METASSRDQLMVLRSRINGDIYKRSPFNRRRIERAGLHRKPGLRMLGDLARIRPMMIDDVASAATLNLTSSARSAKLYQPVCWVYAGRVPLGYSKTDIEYMGVLGQRLLVTAGVSRSDLMANLLPAGATREDVQLPAGAHRAGVASVHLGPERSIGDIIDLGPTVLVGQIDELFRMMQASVVNDVSLRQIHTVLIVGARANELQTKTIEALIAPGGAVVRVWAPPGTMALWSQCRGTDHFHTYEDAEVIEVMDPVSGLPTPEGFDGQLVYTASGWYSTAMVRLATDSYVTAHSGPCAGCGRQSVRVTQHDSAEGFPAVLDRSPHIQEWYAELETLTDHDGLAVWVTPASTGSALEITAELNLKIGPVEIHLADAASVKAKIEEANGERFADRRAFTS